MSHRRSLLHKKSSGFDYQSSSGAFFSLRRLVAWDNALLKIRRTSDNATAYVFFDGDAITLSSLISTSSNTTPDATSLSTWIGSDDGYVEEWYSQNVSGAVGYLVNQTTTGNQPMFISSGVILTKNGKPSIDFLSSTRTLYGGQLSFMGDAEDFTAITVSTADNSGDIGALICNSLTSAYRFAMFHDTRTSGGLYRVAYIATTDGAFAADMLASDGNTTQRLLTAIHDGTSKELTSYKNGVEQNSVFWTNSHTNNLLRIGVQQSGLTEHTGDIQEVLLFNYLVSGDDLTALHEDILNYYGI